MGYKSDLKDYFLLGQRDGLSERGSVKQRGQKGSVCRYYSKLRFPEERDRVEDLIGPQREETVDR